MEKTSQKKSEKAPDNKLTNKLKGSVKSLAPGVIFALFGIFTAVTVGIRTYQLMYIFEPDTGFYFIEQKNNITIPLFYAVAAASGILFLLFSYLSGELAKDKPLGKKNYFLAASSVILAVSLVINAMMVFSDIFNKYEEKMYVSVLEFFIETKTFPQVFEVGFALLAALYFVIVAVSFFTASSAHLSARVMSLMPVCWLICRLVGRFIRAVSFIHVSELFLEIIMIAFLMEFFMGCARILSGIGSKGQLHFTMGTGLCSAMLAFTVSLSRLFTYFFAGSAYLSAESPFEFCDIACALFIVVFLLSCVYNLSPKDRMEKLDRQENKEEVMRTVTVIPSSSASDDEAFKIAEEYSNRYMTESVTPLDVNNRGDISVNKAEESTFVVEPIIARGNENNNESKDNSNV